MKKQTKYYDGTKLLSLLDINGDKPELYICTSNRSAGKTTWFNRYAIKKFKDTGSKSIFLYRYNYELDNCAEKIFKDVSGLFFPKDEMTSKRFAKGMFHELYLSEKPCGYAIALNNADTLKKYSHFFSDADRIIFDEFQSESNHYCANEITKFLSIHTSVSRGQGMQKRYVPVFMIGNPVSLINPYYTELGISTRLKSNTVFLKGEGFVMENGFYQSASDAQKESGLNRAFSRNKYTTYASSNVYLNDSMAFIEKPKGRSDYVVTIKYMGCEYAVREFLDLGIVYVDYGVDKTHPKRITTTTDDHEINYVMLRRHDLFITILRNYFELGCFRFRDLKCKEALIKTISY